MTARADIPPDLTDDEKASLFQYLDASLNSEILYALLYGIYTGILAVTLWHIFINKRWRNRRALVVVIILLYTLISINFAVNWPFVCSAFIQNGQSFWTVYSKLIAVDQAAYLEMDLVLLDGLGTALAYCSASNPFPNFRNCDPGFTYLDAIAGVARGVAPTLLVGRAAAGHTQPTEEHDESSPVSTIRFQTSSQSSQPSQPFTSSFQGSTMQSAVLDMDIEAQTERPDELVVSVMNN
ncbi:uncharacterized protein EV420DRAFT_1765885 [Desarmillaria tabescens]|uniref:Uncharacterized protein n=1 Tax=Armillaria tabescens TaxID=1929756 RepID=A0AA39K3T9_ARMTA|nr:uncharacterized protein EV420DRAFT_1765885 [Desarmillaria tabescens]KAK0454071.1 hypothetical protein EV420DRAFT_1765885 [Desarmillaria tabescens]